jgi:hypothetical protein
MSRTYDRWQRIARGLASSRGEGPYAALAVRFGARLEELCERGDLSPAQRDALWKLVDPYAGSGPLRAGWSRPAPSR